MMPHERPSIDKVDAYEASWNKPLMGLLFFLQWLLLGKYPVFSVWVVVGSIVAYFVILFNATVLQSILIEPLRDRFFPLVPNTLMAKEYYLIKSLIYNTVLGLGIGSFQAVFLKLDSLGYRWWIPMTALAYALTTFWWYYYRVLN